MVVLEYYGNTYTFDSKSRFRLISNGIGYSKSTQLVETLYGSQHFDVAASGSDEIDYHSGARVVGGDSGRNSASAE